MADGADAVSSSGLSENMETMFEFGNVLLGLGMTDCAGEDRGEAMDEAKKADTLSERHERRYFAIESNYLFILKTTII